MNVYHKVVTRITAKRDYIAYAGTVTAEGKPENTCLVTRTADIWEDFFDTKEEAELFVRTQKAEMAKN